MEKVFSRYYSARHQRQFEEALESNDFEKAQKILAQFPSPRLGDATDSAKYLVALKEGFNALADKSVKAYRDFAGSVKDILTTSEIEVEKGERGVIDALEKTLGELREYEEVDCDPKHLAKEIKRLDEYRKLGTPEFVGERLRQLKELDDTLGRIN